MLCKKVCNYHTRQSIREGGQFKGSVFYRCHVTFKPLLDKSSAPFLPSTKMKEKIKETSIVPHCSEPFSQFWISNGTKKSPIMVVIKKCPVSWYFLLNIVVNTLHNLRENYTYFSTHVRASTTIIAMFCVSTIFMTWHACLRIVPNLSTKWFW